MHTNTESSRRLRLIMRLVAAVVLLAGTTAAHASSWTNAVGANAAFGWESGFNNTDHFGDPTVNTDGFFFTNPVDFKAQLGIESVTDFARVRIDTKDAIPSAADPITVIRVVEWGTYSGQISDFTLQADYSIIRYDPTPVRNTGLLTADAVFDPDGTWYWERWLHVGDTVPGFPPNPFTWVAAREFQITVTNTIQVEPDAAQGGAWIQKNGMVIIIPEPSTLLLLAFSGVVMLRRFR